VCPPQLKCPYCKKETVIYDRLHEEYVCTECGTVIQYYCCSELPEFPEESILEEIIEVMKKHGFSVSPQIYDIYGKLKGTSRVRAVTAAFCCTEPRITLLMAEKMFGVSRYSILRCLKRSNISWRQVRSNA